MPAVADMQNSIVKEFENHPEVVVLPVNQGGLFRGWDFGENQDWFFTAWSNYYLRGAVMFDAEGDTARDVFAQPMSGLPFGRGYIVDKSGTVADVFFCHRPEWSVERIYGLLEEIRGFTVWIPHLTGGNANWEDVLSVDNPTDATRSFAVKLYDASGNVVATETYHLEARDSVDIPLKSLAAEAVVGKVTAVDDQLLIRVGYHYRNTGGLAQFVLDAEPSAALDFLFANGFPNSINWKGLAVANAGAEPLPVTIQAFGDGELLGEVDDVIPGVSRIRGTHGAWFPELTVDQVQRIRVIAGSSRLSGITISGNDTNSNLLFAPAMPVN